MANITQKQILLDGPRNAVVKLTGVLDTADIYLTPAIALQDFLTNDANGVLNGLRIDHVQYAIGSGIELLLEWAGAPGGGATPQQIAPLAGRGRMDVWADGGWFPNEALPLYNGSINLKSTGFMTGKQNYTLTLAMVKLYGSGWQTRQ